MNILIGCECSGRVRDAFIANGHNAVSCDFKPSEVGGPHIMGDVMSEAYSCKYDAMIAFPPCTHLASTGRRHFDKKRESGVQQAAIKFVYDLMNAPIKHKAFENPIGVLSTELFKPDQIVHPWHFGDNYPKATCFWLFNLPKLVPSVLTAPEIEYVTLSNGKKFSKWYYESSIIPVEQRATIRSRFSTYMAAAMGKQWGDYLHSVADNNNR